MFENLCGQHPRGWQWLATALGHEQTSKVQSFPPLPLPPPPNGGVYVVAHIYLFFPSSHPSLKELMRTEMTNEQKAVGNVRKGWTMFNS